VVLHAKREGIGIASWTEPITN